MWLILFGLITVLGNTIDDQSRAEKPQIDSTYIRYFSGRFNMRTFVTNRDLSWSVQHRRRNVPRVTYAPNADYFIGIGAYVFDVGIEAAIRLPTALQRDPVRYGETQALDIQTNVYGKRWNFDLAYQNYQGYYLQNAPGIVMDFSDEDSFPQRPKLQAKNLFLNTIYVGNPERFSFRSGFKYGELQTKSQGSWLMVMALSYFTLDSEESIIPLSLREAYGEAGTLRQGRFMTLGLLPGYGYNARWCNFFMNARLFGGVGLQHQQYWEAEHQTQRFSLRTKFNFRMATGYDNQRWFAGTRYVFQRTDTSLKDLRLSSDVHNLRFFVGYRFQEVGVLKRYSVKDLLKSIRPPKHRIGT